MTTPKHKQLTVQIHAKLTIDYNQQELDAMGKTFREFKHGVEHLVRERILPDFQADRDSKVEVLTIGYPTSHKLKKVKHGND